PAASRFSSAPVVAFSTATSFEMRFATNRCLPARSSTTLEGSAPTGHVATSFSARVSTTDTVSSHVFATNKRRPSGDNENPRGTWPTGIVLIALNVALFRTRTSSLPWHSTYSRVPSGEYTISTGDAYVR